MKIPDRYRYRPGRSRRRSVRNGAVLLTVVGLLLYLGYTRSVPFKGPGGYAITAEFADATSLQPGSDVRVHGVSVGRVENVRLADDLRSATVRMRVRSDSGVVVYRDARAQVYWRTLLGRNTYVELDPGTRGAGRLGDRTLPLNRTKVQQEIDTVLSPLGEDQRVAVRRIARELERGFRARDAVRTSVDELGDAGTSIRRGLRGLRGVEPGDLTALVRNASRTMGVLARSDQDLEGLIDGADTTLGVTAARSDAIGSLVDQAPETLADTRTTLERLERTLDALDPVAVGLLPGARQLRVTARRARPLLTNLDHTLRVAEPTLRDLRPAVADVERLAPPARGLINDLQPTVDRLNGDLLPWLGATDPETKMRNYTAVGAFSSVMASAASTFDANGHILNFQSFLDERSLLTLGCTLRLTDPSATGQERIDCSNLAHQLAAGLGQAPPNQLGDYDVEKDQRTGRRTAKEER